VSPLRAEDLPPALRARLEAQEGPIRGRPGRSQAQGRETSRVRCHLCPDVVVDWNTGTPKAARDHSDATGHVRWDLVL
jgi:hypothetical protein